MAAAGVVGLVVQEPATHIGEGVGAELGWCVGGGFTVDVAGLGEAEGGFDECAGFGFEAAPQFAAPI